MFITIPPPPSIAPRVPNLRSRVLWDKGSLSNYSSLTSSALPLLRASLGSSTSCLDILMESTNQTLTRAASASFKSLALNSNPAIKPRADLPIIRAQSSLLSASKLLRDLLHSYSPSPTSIAEASDARSKARSLLQRLNRARVRECSRARDSLVDSILSSNPRNLFRAIKCIKGSHASLPSKLSVGPLLFQGPHVPDGFYHSLRDLKVPDMAPIHATPSFQSAHLKATWALEICQAGPPIPSISRDQALALLKRLRPDVLDIFSISARHFLNAGDEGITHFSFLLNAIIGDTNSFSSPGLNTAWAIVLHKGHSKPKDNSRSYRCISTCPLLGKALDLWVLDHNRASWAAVRAPTQFMHPGSSHDLGSVLLTEVILHSLHISHTPLYLLLLDAKSAFDMVLADHVLNAAFLAGTQGQDLLYIAARLSSRLSFIEFNKELMGPIPDKRGVEQGGTSSMDLFQLVNNGAIIAGHHSGLGTNLPGAPTSTIGAADDIALVSSSLPGPVPSQPGCLLHQGYPHGPCGRQNQTAVLPPTLPLPGCAVHSGHLPLIMNGVPVAPVKEADHLGILRSTSGPLPAIMARIAAFDRALYSVLPAGLARHHTSNPAASLRILRLYAEPVLLSGLAALVLNKGQLATLAHHHKLTTQRLLKLHSNTPRAAVYLIGGSLPLDAILHLRVLSLLGMISRLSPSHILVGRALAVLTNPSLSKRVSWFTYAVSIYNQYQLPHLSSLLDSPPTKSQWKSTCKSAVVALWQRTLSAEASALPSLFLLRSTHLSLSKPHRLLSTCPSGAYPSHQAAIMARVLSGKYPSCWHKRHWDLSDGSCSLPGCGAPMADTFHIFSGSCPSLLPIAKSTLLQWWTHTSPYPPISGFLQSTLARDPRSFFTFVMDPSSDPGAMTLAQALGPFTWTILFWCSRQWVFNIHRDRLTQLNLRKYI